MAPEAALLASHFDDLPQQHRAARLGMWIFLVTEVMLFGGLFTGYVVYRSLYGAAFDQASHHLDLAAGTVNTGVLLTSSLTMALGVHAATQGRRRLLVALLLLTLLLGAVFLGVKAFEYLHKIREGLLPGHRFRPSAPPGFELFFSLYFVMTGMHALHMGVGLAILGVLTAMALRRRMPLQGNAMFEIAGLYWHFVDIVWVFLFPLLYLLGRHQP